MLMPTVPVAIDARHVIGDLVLAGAALLVAFGITAFLIEQPEARCSFLKKRTKKLFVLFFKKAEP